MKIVFNDLNVLGKPEKLREMILSIPEHLANVHNFPVNTHHKECEHPPLTGARDKEWLGKESLVWFGNPQSFQYFNLFQAVQKVRSALVGKDNCRIDDLPHMVGFTHTGSIGRNK